MGASTRGRSSSGAARGVIDAVGPDRVFETVGQAVRALSPVEATHATADSTPFQSGSVSESMATVIARMSAVSSPAATSTP
jgi:hypothetical protein